jgi:hypothetical protein
VLRYVVPTKSSLGLLKQVDAWRLNVGMPKRAPSAGRWSSSSTAGRITFTATSVSRLCLLRGQPLRGVGTAGAFCCRDARCF